MDDTRRSNRKLWDARTQIHIASDFYDLQSFKSGENRIRLTDYERDEVGAVTGKSLLHLQCHFGLDTLSWARLGATVAGADFSPRSIAAARELALEVDLQATFVESDLYALPDHLDADFDIVYTSRSVLGWLPDIEGRARVVSHFVKPGGMFYITDIHPVADALDDQNVSPGDVGLAYPYWSHAEPLTFNAQGSYADRSAPTPGLVEHVWNRSLGEIVTALIASPRSFPPRRCRVNRLGRAHEQVRNIVQTVTSDGLLIAPDQLMGRERSLR